MHNECAGGASIAETTNDEQMETEDLTTSTEFSQRARIVIGCLLDYALELICWGFSDILPPSLTCRLIKFSSYLL